MSEQVVFNDKISLKDLDFDNLDECELSMIKDEIEIIISIRKLAGERMVYIKKNLEKEKEVLRNKMLEDIKREQEKIRIRLRLKEVQEEADEEEEEDVEEAVIYDKSNPKGKVTRRKTQSRKK
jgi:hypothetical protein